MSLTPDQWIARLRLKPREEILQYLSSRSDSLRNAPPQVIEDKEYLQTALQRSGYQYTFLTDAQKSDPEIALLALKHSYVGQLWSHFPASLTQSPEFITKCMAIKPSEMLSVLKLSSGFSRDFIIDLLRTSGDALLCLSPEDRNDRQLVMIAVKQNGLALAHVTDEQVKADADIVMAAVEKNGLALQYAAPHLKSQHDIVMTALKQNSKAWTLVSEQFFFENPSILDEYLAKSASFLPKVLDMTHPKPASHREEGKQDRSEQAAKKRRVAKHLLSSKGDGSLSTIRFPSPFCESDCPYPRTLLDHELRQLSHAIRSKPEWQIKYKNPEITEKWRREAMQSSDRIARKGAFEYVLKELEYHEQIEAAFRGRARMSQIDGVYESIDEAFIPEELRIKLLSEVKQLEDVPDDVKDWHPDSGSQVLDLVHPSLFPFCSGKTRVVLGLIPPSQRTVEASFQRLGMGDKVTYDEIWSEVSRSANKSEQFQWLPSEFEVDPNTGKVTIQSYINNLHPHRFQGLYNTIERIFERFVPLFESVLGDLLSPMPLRYELSAYDWYNKSYAQSNDTEEEKKQQAEEEKAKKKAKEGDQNEVEMGDNEQEEEEEEEEEEEDWDNRTLYFPSVAKCNLDNYTDRHGPFNLGGRRLQVIVKLANIVLNPENPKYNGGVWHIEGMENERIVASGIYYYQSENISDSYLAFRQSVSDPDYEQSDDRGVAEAYGLASDEPLVQELGSVLTKTNLCLAWPNTLQHCVQRFELLDKTKPGIRKILVFFLIDPLKPVLSTENCPPQQMDWIRDSLKEKGVLDDFFPRDLHPTILDYALGDYPSLEETKADRLELMKERKYFHDYITEEVQERIFSLCEH